VAVTRVVVMFALAPVGLRRVMESILARAAGTLEMINSEGGAGATSVLCELKLTSPPALGLIWTLHFVETSAQAARPRYCQMPCRARLFSSHWWGFWELLVRWLGWLSALIVPPPSAVVIAAPPGDARHSVIWTNFGA